MEPETKPPKVEQDIQLEAFEKKRKPKKTPTPATTDQKQSTPKVNHEERYIELLKRIRKQLQDNNPELASKSKIVIKPPVIEKFPKKSVIKNFGEICCQLNRDQQHVMNFFLSELSAEGSVAGGDINEKQAQLTIKNRLQPKNVESLFIKYIKQFVRCQPCGSQNTTLEKDKQTRLQQLQCQACKATRRVAQIKKRG